MTKETRTADGWLSEIAAKAKVDRSVAKVVLDRYHIKPQAALPRRRPIAFQAIALKGAKSGTRSDGPIDCKWSALGNGLWTLTSDRNGRGKSSMLRLMMGALRGDWPQDIKDDVWKWLSRVDVDFTVDNVAHRARLEKPEGSESKQDALCNLYRVDARNELEIYSGPPGKPFEAAVNEVFQGELGFAEIRTFNKDTASDASHGWQSMASALFINEPGKAIFGEVTVGGMPLRLLQLFIGLPWISTYTQAITAQKMLEQQRPLPAQSPSLQRYRERLAQLETQLVESRGQVVQGSRRPLLRKRLAELDVLLVQLHEQVAKARTCVDAQAEQHVTMSRSLVEARRMLQSIKDEQAAGVVFRSLRPMCCPSCESRIDGKRYEAANAPSCALCGSAQEADVGETDRLAEASEDIASLQAQTEAAAKNLAAAQAHLSRCEQERTQCEVEATEIGRELSQVKESEQEQKIVALEAQIAQLRDLISEETPKTVPETADRAIVAAAATVTESYFKELQGEILVEVSQEVTRLSGIFGVQNLASIEIQRGGTTKVMQGGAETSFSKMTKGEKLRIRIAAALAVIEVSRARSYGRHPGLLVLDSPAREEMTNDDFARLIGSVRGVVDAAPDIQVIVGAIAKPELLRNVANERTRYARGDDYLF